MTSFFQLAHGHCQQSRCCGHLWFAVRTHPIHVLVLAAAIMGVALEELASVKGAIRELHASIVRKSQALT